MSDTPAFEVIVDRERCSMSSNCSQIVAEVFEQSLDDGRAIVLNRSPPEDLWGAVEEASACCPSGAIEVVRRTPH